MFVVADLVSLNKFYMNDHKLIGKIANHQFLLL